MNVDKGTGLNRAGMGDQIGKVIETVVMKFKSYQSDVNLKRLCQDVVKIYIESLSEIADCSMSLSTDEESLIHVWVGQYLSICSVNEISSLLTAFSTLLTRARMLLCSVQSSAMPTAEQMEDIKKLQLVVTQLWAILYPAVKQLAVSLTAPAGVGTIAADFIIQRAESSGSAAGHGLEDMVKFFTQNKNVPVDISANVLYSISHNSAVSRCVQSDTLMTSVAVCSITAPPGTEAYQLLNKAWLQMVGGEGEADDTDVAVMVMMQNMTNTSLISVMCGFCCDTNVRRGELAIVRQYQVAGWLVYHCSNILYNPRNNFTNHIATIINNLLTPNIALSPTWNPTLHQKKAVRQSMMFFLQGIMTHQSFLEEDKFLIRKLSEIVRIYVPRYDASRHPLLNLLSKPSLVDNQDICFKAAGVTLEIVVKVAKDNLKTGQIVISCIKYLEAATLNPQSCLTELTVNKALTTLLEILSMAEDKNVKNPIIVILKFIFRTLESDDGLKQLVTQKLRTFVNFNLAFNSERVFNSLKVISVLNKSVIIDVLPHVGIEVEKVEKKRGSGKDSKLRNAYNNLQSSVLD